MILHKMGAFVKNALGDILTRIRNSYTIIIMLFGDAKSAISKLNEAMKSGTG